MHVPPYMAHMDYAYMAHSDYMVGCSHGDYKGVVVKLTNTYVHVHTHACMVIHSE